MGNSLNEVLPFLLGDGNISGIPNFTFHIFEMMASLGKSRDRKKSDDVGKSGTHNFQTHGGNHKIENEPEPAFSLYS